VDGGAEVGSRQSGPEGCRVDRVGRPLSLANGQFSERELGRQVVEPAVVRTDRGTDVHAERRRRTGKN